MKPDSGAPLLWLVVGPNGAGKTTYYQQQIQPRLRAPFVNADLIAAERWPDAVAEHAYEAAQMADQLRHRLLAANRSFVAETVFSHPSKVELIREAKRQGYLVWLSFIYLESADLAVARVGCRVRESGHFVPPDKIRARYHRLVENLRCAIPLVDTLFMIDNSRDQAAFRTVAVYHQGNRSYVNPDAPDWMRLFA